MSSDFPVSGPLLKSHEIINQFPKEKASTKAAPSDGGHSGRSQQDDGRAISLQEQGLTRGIVNREP